jgi:hypothetical protein
MGEWEWILTMPSRRRKQLIRAAYRRQERGEPARDYGYIKPHVKDELMPYFKVLYDLYMSSETEYIARLIQAPHDETHLDAGRFLKPLVYRLKHIWSMSHWIYYASDKPENLDLWLRRNRDACSWFWSDYSAFDSTFSPQAWAMIERLYGAIYPHAPPEFWSAIEAWRKPKGRVVNKKDNVRLAYDAPVMNASGRDDTALANALLNGIVLSCSIAAAYFNVPVISVQPHHLLRISSMVNIAVVGDDSAVACSFDVRPIQDRIVANIAEFGLVAKAGSSSDLVDLTFLGMMPYVVAGEMYWGPTIGRRLYKAFWQREPTGNLPAWTHGVAQQLAMYQCVPVLSDMANQVLKLLSGTKITRAASDEYSVWSNRTIRVPAYDDSTIEWLARRYKHQSLGSASIRADIAAIGEINRLPCMIRLHTTDAALVSDDL